MKTKAYRILHLSDIHFGKTNDHVIDFIPRQGIDLLILTGDLTQRAKTSEFAAALKFIQTFSCPVFLIPGNHDVPLFNVFLRIFSPYRKFRKSMKNYLAEYYEDEKVAAFGLWTQNRFTVKSGKLYRDQVGRLAEKMRTVSGSKLKIIAAHHPLSELKSHGSKPEWQALLSSNPDLILWGHEHQSSAEYFDPVHQKGPVLVAAGTGFSSRTRQESNSYNLIQVWDDKLEIEIWNHSSEVNSFLLTKTGEFQRNSKTFRN